MKLHLHLSRFALILALAAPASAAEPAARPNIVFIISDDQAWSDYGFMGHPQISTPRLDMLASESLAFHRGYLQNPDQENRFAPRSKLSPYEGEVRTPIMISWPGRFNPRMEKTHLASSIDLWPTLAALLKTDAPAGLPGINLTDDNTFAKRAAVFGEQYAHNIADVKQPTLSLQHRWVIDGWWKLISPDPHTRPGSPPELYDLENDPWEKTNLAESDPARVKALTAQLDQWWKNPAKTPAKP